MANKPADISKLQQLKDTHRQICQMSFEGYSTDEIAEKFSVHVATVRNVLKSPIAVSYLAGLSDRLEETTIDVRQRLIQMNTAALDAFDRILDPKQKAPFSVQYNTARDILDRNGYKAPDKISVDMTLSGKTDEEIDAEIAAAEENLKRLYDSDTTPSTEGACSDETAENGDPAMIGSDTSQSAISDSSDSTDTLNIESDDILTSDELFSGIMDNSDNDYTDFSYDPETIADILAQHKTKEKNLSEVSDPDVEEAEFIPPNNIPFPGKHLKGDN